MNNQRPLDILLCCPDFSREHGGIQQFSRLLASALHASPSTARVHILSYPGTSSPLHKAAYAFRLVAAMLRRWDLCLFTHVGLARTVPILELHGVPCWIFAHGIECWNIRRGGERRSLQRAARVLAVSRHTRDRLLADLPELDGRLEVFPNHVEQFPDFHTPQEEARRQLGLPSQSILLLTISRLRHDRYKGHREILTALAALGPARQNVHYVIAGDGEDRESLQEETRLRGLADRVHFLGSIDERQRALAYDACDGFVMPSTGEGFGIVFLEAMAHGKPVLAGGIDGSRDAVDAPACGVLVNPRDPAAVAAGLSELLSGISATPPRWQPRLLQEYVRSHFGRHKLQERVDRLLEGFTKEKTRCVG
ncbi:MAG: glycosyltransferase family 4 protein [Candidatus Methylacidiphilales bacterium]|nr:glycosyltransferase family 4 protein [Candidatus Methylacidiphilales bacterium]